MNLALVPDPTREQLSELASGLVAYNESVAPPSGHRGVLLTLRDDAGRLVGGAGGYTHWGWLFVSHLWVDGSLRGQDWGRRLLAAIEQEAVNRGCRHAHLDTFSFQALGFYEKQGYVRFGQLEDYPAGSGHTRYFLTKRELG